MGIREIQAELNERRIRFTDCIDKEQLVERLVDPRSGKVKPAPAPAPPPPPPGAADGFGAQTRIGEQDSSSMEDAFRAAGWTGQTAGDPSKVDQARSPGMKRDFSQIDRDDFKKSWRG